MHSYPYNGMAVVAPKGPSLTIGTTILGTVSMVNWCPYPRILESASQKSRCLHMFGNRNTPAGHRLLIYSVISQLPQYISPKELYLWCSSKVILHSEDHINKLVYYSGSRTPLQILQTSPSPSGKILLNELPSTPFMLHFCSGNLLSGWERNPIETLFLDSLVKQIAWSLFAWVTSLNLCLSYSSRKKVVQEGPAYFAVCCATSRGTRECRWSCSFS